jgi:formamidopyrimidine-DNA glycosylase
MRILSSKYKHKGFLLRTWKCGCGWKGSSNDTVQVYTGPSRDRGRKCPKCGETVRRVK